MSFDPRELTDVELLTHHYKNKLDISGFLLVNINENHPTKWGEYFVEYNTIVIYSGEMTLSRFNLTVLHEISHYMCIKLYDDPTHGKFFKKILRHLLDLYYDYNVPSEIIELLKGDDLYYEFESTKERRESQLELWGTWEMAKAQC